MNKIFKFLSAVALIAGSSLVLQSCVEDNSYVIVKGLVPLADDGSEACDATSDDQIYQHKAIGMFEGHINVRNYISADSGWSSSSGSSSGSTFEPEPPNRGMVYVDKIVVKCHSIDGDKKACKGKENIEQLVNYPLSSGGGGLCLSLYISASQYTEWNSQSEIVFDISVKYHDTGILHGTSSSSIFTLVTDPEIIKAWEEEQKRKEEEKNNSSSGSDSESGDQGNEKT